MPAEQGFTASWNAFAHTLQSPRPSPLALDPRGDRACLLHKVGYQERLCQLGQVPLPDGGLPPVRVPHAVHVSGVGGEVRVEPLQEAERPAWPPWSALTLNLNLNLTLNLNLSLRRALLSAGCCMAILVCSEPEPGTAGRWMLDAEGGCWAWQP